MSLVNGLYVGPGHSHPPPGNRHTGTVRNGDGVPDSSLGQDGDVYVDELTGDVYSKDNGSWNIIQGAPGGSGAIGAGSPEGVATATPGTTYWDSTNKQLWLKETGTGNSGWTPY